MDNSALALEESRLAFADTLAASLRSSMPDRRRQNGGAAPTSAGSRHRSVPSVLQACNTAASVFVTFAWEVKSLTRPTKHVKLMFYGWFQPVVGCYNTSVGIFDD